jgi:myo-inositol-1(or 4)-monophosphatase
MLAAGRVDVYYEAGLGPWDMAAGELIAREAGAVTGDFGGGPARPAEVLAAVPALRRRWFLALLAGA